MSATGIKTFTMAFILDNGGCEPGWDGKDPLSRNQQAVSDIRAAGGDVRRDGNVAVGTDQLTEAPGALSPSTESTLSPALSSAVRSMPSETRRLLR